MSLIKKADVQDYLSARRGKTVFPFGPISQPAAGDSGDGSREAKVNEPKSRQVQDREHPSIRPSASATESQVSSAPQRTYRQSENRKRHNSCSKRMLKK
jgi:hypothetical protein